MNCDHLLVDGKNIMYRAVLSKRDDNTHPVTIIARQIKKWQRELQPSQWHIFWDVAKSDLWRKEVYPDYKEGRVFPHRDYDIKETIKESQKITAELFNNLGFTQYIRSKNEADDLIYAYVLAHEDKKLAIVSSDGDITQIAYRHNVLVYNPDSRKKSFVEKPIYDPVIIKALCGDNSDNINGYRMVAEKTATKILSKGTLKEFLSKHGMQPFKRNIDIIDMRRNPYLQDNVEYVRSVPRNKKFDIKAVQNMIPKYGLSGLAGELSGLQSFKNTREE